MWYKPSMAITQMDIEKIGPEIGYTDVVNAQESAVAGVLVGEPQKLFFVEHAPIYTLGTSANPTDVLNSNIPSLITGRGGQVTYHGPGQRVLYPILDLRQHKQDLRWYINQLQQWMVATLAAFDISGQIIDDVGVWVETDAGLAKIAAIGVRVRRWVTFHGVALNVAPDLRAFDGIIPCGITDKRVTSMRALGCTATMDEVDEVILAKFHARFSA